MNDGAFLQAEFFFRVARLLVIPAGICDFLLRRSTIAHWIVLVMASYLVVRRRPRRSAAVAGRVGQRAAVFAGIAARLLSHVLIEHPDRPGRRFVHDHAGL
ncbi:MAG TPA: hypothetical protein PLO14_11640 [Accumulibacter sp.]|uniref:hypothetical protein n=1 Tax=Accumulibacter sp. TaxID=2053492 RepID=UPI0025E809FB|nr:hypothetical protein [Accumulibacter sp.]MCM8598826.1 hypothetical protein [Accumulibacter sp.]MCM8662911.1 hypothetical protein [Accumulibacter sp.]HNC52874.1 hypothetical protein [Accumulibacter sp.]